MFGFLLALLILDGALLTIIVLLQSGKGGGLASMGGGMGTDTLIGGRQAATLLTKGTWVTAGIFLFLAVVLSVLSSRAQRGPESVLRNLPRQQAPAAAPAPVQIPGTQPQQGTQAPAQGTTPAPATTGQ